MPPPGPQFTNHFEKTYLQVMRVMRFWWSGMDAGPLHRDDIHWVRSPDGVLLWMSYTDAAKGLFSKAPNEMATKIRYFGGFYGPPAITKWPEDTRAMATTLIPFLVVA